MYKKHEHKVGKQDFFAHCVKLVLYNTCNCFLYQYVFRSTVITITFLLGVQVHSQDKEPNTKVTGRITLLLYVYILRLQADSTCTACVFIVHSVYSAIATAS